MRIDFGRTQADYAAHRAPFVPQLFERLQNFNIGLPGQNVLDLGAGTGLFADAIAKNGSHTILVDPSLDLLREANQEPKVAAAAEQLPFADESFDVVIAAQCWHWFDRNRAPREISRVLRAGGCVAAIYQTYIPLPQSIAEATERLILRHNPGWRHANSTGINGQVLRDVQAAGFTGIESFSFDIEVTFTRESWRGFIRTTSPVGASMASARIEQFDREHEQLLHDWPETLLIPHRVFAAIARKPG